MPERSAFWGLLRNHTIVAVFALAADNLWPLWLPSTPRPWNDLMSEAEHFLRL